MLITCVVLQQKASLINDKMIEMTDRASSYEPGNRAGLVPRRILLSVHMGNFSPVYLDKIRETQPK